MHDTTVYIIVLRHCIIIVLKLCMSLCSHCVRHCAHTVYVIMLTLCMSLCSHTLYIFVLTHCEHRCAHTLCTSLCITCTLQSFLTATTRAQITNRAARLSPHISAARTTRAGSCELYLRHQISGSHVESVLL